MQPGSSVKLPFETDADINPLIHGYSYDPHHYLGLHSLPNGKKVIRLWRPDASEIAIELFGQRIQLEKTHPAGLFAIEVPAHTQALDYRVYHQSGLLDHDPYSFLPAISDFDLYLFNKGVHYELWKVMGGRLFNHQSVNGVRFVVWAPNAKQISLVGDFNHWNGKTNPMRSLGSSGVWELFVPGLIEGEKYKFEIRTQDGTLHLKSDPYAYCSQLRPATASVIANLQKHQWQDQAWMDNRIQNKDKDKPMAIYEVHLGSWKKKDGYFKNYRELAQELVDYCQMMGFTHVELMPIAEHPLDESWGYQVTGYYAATSRYGSPEDFQWFVDLLHRNDIGVLLDWVPGHFPADDFALRQFDGTALYEHADQRKGFHPHWNTCIFNLGRAEVSNFLIANALFWLKEMHIDGLRVDAVASMLYLDYGRNAGEWIPNQYGGNENIESIEFMKHLNSIIHQQTPGTAMIAEESTAFYRVSHPVEQSGLGFDMKWNMGWMNDTLRYFSKDTIHRSWHQNDLTFGLLYAFSEHYVLVLSHDEVVHGKRSLLSRMPGDPWQKFANLRLLYSYMICQPGKKLLFMGGELAQWNEWSCSRELEWDLLKFIPHQEIQRMVKEINYLYREHPALWERDFNWTGFEWVDYADTNNSVVSYLRKSTNEILLCVHNFTPNYHQEYFIALKNLATVQELFNSDAYKYGGSGKINLNPTIVTDADGHAIGLKIEMAPLATMIFKITFWG